MFPDHHAFQPADLAFADGLPVLMTEKDAVKCAPFAEPHWWYLPVTASLPEGLLEQMLDAGRWERNSYKLQATTRNGVCFILSVAGRA